MRRTNDTEYRGAQACFGQARRARHVNQCELAKLFDALGTPSRDVTVLYLADLIDPSAWKVTVADNERLLDRCRELEAENARLKVALAKGVER